MASKPDTKSAANFKSDDSALIRELALLLDETSLTEIEIERAGLRVRVGTLADIEAANPGLPVADGFPAYVPQAKAFVVLVEPGDGFRPGSDATGTGAGVNVIALSQRCPHLGCRPEPCLEDWWMHCPCHQSRYDRLGIKPAGLTYGPAPRSMDRYAVEVSDTGVLTVDMARIVMGPLPIALGQPGVIPPRVEHGCL